MKIQKLVLAGLLSFGLLSHSQATIVNGGFETGGYTGWTLSENSGNPTFGTWGIAATGSTINPGDATFDYYDGLLVTQTSPGLPRTYTATEGQFLAYQLQNGGEMHRMYQDISVINAASVSLIWDMFYQDFSGAFSAGQYLAVSLRDLSDGLLMTLFQTSAGDPGMLPMTSFYRDISMYAGSTVRLDITMNVQNFYFDAGFDNFQIMHGDFPIPEPTPLALLGLGLISWLAQRRHQL